MAWFVLTKGAPTRPSYDDLSSGQTQPTPLAVLSRLFQELTGTALKSSRKLVREQQGFDEIARGYCGNKEVGYAWDYLITIGDSAQPADETYVTYGLPSATLIWAVSYWKRGQSGYSTWTNRYLRARFDDDARDTVERVWTEMLGVAPVFVPASPEKEQEYEDFAQEREERLRVDLRPKRRTSRG